MNDERLLRVIKIGGSLLKLPDLGRRLCSFQKHENEFFNLYIVGGGELANQVRRLDQMHDLSANTSHTAGLQAMSINTLIVAELCEWNWSRQFDQQLVEEAATSHLLLDCSAFSEVHLQQGQGQQNSWRITSDSIAAILADHFQAAELILLKSKSTPNYHSWEELSHKGFVDLQFSEFATKLPAIRFGSPNATGFAIGPPYKPTFNRP